MALKRLTITGADDAVSPRDMVRLSEQYPFLEWAILLSEGRSGTARYPSEEWRTRLLDIAASKKIHLAAHLCGRYTARVLEGEDLSVKWVPERYGRVQVNGFMPTRRFLNMASDYRHWIFQARDSWGLSLASASAWILGGNRASVLYDPSGGTGKVTAAWPESPDPTIRMGGAGGITPDTIESVATSVPWSYRWLDMESGARTEDRLDLDKVALACERLAPFIEV